MKKSLLVMLFTMMVFIITGCSDEGFESAEVQWLNESSENLTNIRWVDGDNIANQTWSEDAEIANGDKTDFKEVTLETGKGLAFLEGGAEAELLINGGKKSYKLSDGESEVLNINETTRD